PYNTLYLELHCPAVAPSVVVTSDNGKNTVDFGDVAVVLVYELFSLSCAFQLQFSVLNPSGPFLLVRSVRTLEPGEIRTLIISFSPNKNKSFFEVLDIQTVKSNLSLRIAGYGVTPSTVCSVEEVLDLGYVLAREKATSTFKVQNTSTLTLHYSVHLDSLSSTRDRDCPRFPSFVSSVRRTELIGTENCSGVSAFSVVPTEGEIDAGKSQDFVVTFSPDHEGLYCSECLKVVLFGKKTAHVIQLKGAARDRPMFVEGGVALDVPIESLAAALPLSLQKALQEGTVLPLAVSHSSELQDVGCSSSGDYTKGNLSKRLYLNSNAATGFCVCIFFQASAPLMETAFLTLKGNVKESYRVLFVATVVSAPKS
ncbi:hypothetical protein ASZ78_001230, partial [Callipepla squamata]